MHSERKEKKISDEMETDLETESKMNVVINGKQNTLNDRWNRFHVVYLQRNVINELGTSIHWVARGKCNVHTSSVVLLQLLSEFLIS